MLRDGGEGGLVIDRVKKKSKKLTKPPAIFLVLIQGIKDITPLTIGRPFFIYFFLLVD